MFNSVSYLDDLYSLLQKLEPCSVNIITQLFFSKYGVKLQLKDINARLERIEPKVHSSDGLASSYTAVEIKPASQNPKRSSSKAKSSTREVSLFGGLCVYPLLCRYFHGSNVQKIFPSITILLGLGH